MILTAAEFRNRIAALGYTQRGFAAYLGANERTIRRWAEDSHAIPPWVSVILNLMERMPNERRTRHQGS